MPPSIQSLTLRAYLPSFCTLHPVALGVTFLLSRICPTGVSGAAGALHESGCPSLVLLLWPWSHLFLLFIAAPCYWDLRPSHSVAPSMVFPTHGYRGTTPWLPYFSTVWSGDALVGRRLHLGDTLPWRRFLLASLHPGDALRWLWLSSRWLWPWLSQRPDTGRYSFAFWYPEKLISI